MISLMTLSSPPAAQCFGTNLVAMVTPMEADGTISTSGASALVDHLLASGCDGIVVAGTSGEAPTLSEGELVDLVRLVREVVGGRTKVTVGIGMNDTAATVQRARLAEGAGADALLLVCPYYSRPTQAGVVAHCLDVAEATSLPVMLYDVPARTGTAMDATTLVALSRHPRIRAIKDAKGDLFEAMNVMASTPLEYYCGIDELNLPYLAIGATGVLSVVGNVAAAHNAHLIDTVRAGDLTEARRIHTSLAPLIETIMRTSQGAITAKAALHELGVIPHATVRGPLMEAMGPDRMRIAAALPLAGLPSASAGLVPAAVTPSSRRPSSGPG